MSVRDLIMTAAGISPYFAEYVPPDPNTLWPRFYKDSLNAVTTFNNKFVIAAENTFYISNLSPIGGTTFDRVQIDFQISTNNSIACSSNLIVAVGDFGQILTSTDLYNWTLGTSNVTTSLMSVTSSPSLFVAVGNSGTIITSPDGINWTPRNPPNSAKSFKFVTYQNGLYIITGWSEEILTSVDGITWTQRRTSGSSLIHGAVWTGTEFIAVGDSSLMLFSVDGFTWSVRSPGLSKFFTGIYSINSLLVLIGQSGFIATSTNGTLWTTRSSGVANSLRCVSSNASEMIFVGDSGVLASSLDGLTWSLKTTVFHTNNFYGVTYGNSKWVAVGNNSVSSIDGNTWTIGGSFINYMSSVLWTGTCFIAVGSVGRIYKSLDGISWTLKTSGVTNNIHKVVWTGTRIVAVGGGGRILTSDDQGDTWVIRTSNTTVELYSLAFSGSTLVAIGDSYSSTFTILNSLDGITWTHVSHNIASATSAKKVAYGGGIFLLSASQSFLPRIWSSPDGINWTLRNDSSITDTPVILYDGSKFLILSSMLCETVDGEVINIIQYNIRRFADAFIHNNILVGVNRDGHIAIRPKPLNSSF